MGRTHRVGGGGTALHGSILCWLGMALLPLASAFASPATQNRIAFTRGGDIWVKDLTSGVETRLTTHRRDDAWPAWSPDKSRIVFSSERDGNYEIYVMNADGTGQTRLTNHRATDNGPQWSPDGDWILFNSNRGDGLNLYKLRLDAPATWTDPIPVTGQAAGHPETAGGSWGSWSPDGTMIAFLKGSPNYGLYVANADGSAPQWLVQNLFSLHCDWSPVFHAETNRYRSRLAFTMSDHTWVAEITWTGAGASSAELGAPYQVTGALGGGVRASFSPDGQFVAVLMTHIWSVPADGSGTPASLLVTSPSRRESVGRPAWKSQ